MLQKGGGLSEPTLYVSSEFTAPDKIRKKRRMEFSLKRASFFPGWHGGSGVDADRWQEAISYFFAYKISYILLDKGGGIGYI